MRALLTGGGGMLGGAIAGQWRALRPDDGLRALTRQDVDLRDRARTAELISDEAPDVIIHAAARVGGILAKTAHPTPYLLDNLLIDTSVISAAVEAGVPSLLYIGSAAVYPVGIDRPILESDLLAGALESANEGYAVAKIAGLKLCEYAAREFGLDYRAAIPSNLYGPDDDYSLSHGHLVAAAIAKVDHARRNGLAEVEIWGDGTARREFTYSGDLAAWLVRQSSELAAWPTMLNLGVGHDHTIAEYYEAARRVVGWDGSFVFDPTKPAGVQRRILDSGVARDLGWAPTTSLDDGMATAYARFMHDDSRSRTS